MSEFIFSDHYMEFGSDCIVARLNQIKDKEDLLFQLSTQLKFPDYFGFNWDALTDCLSDFDWIDQKTVVIIHEDCPKLNPKDMEIYIGTLYDSIGEWKDSDVYYGKVRLLEVVFPESCKDTIENYVEQVKKRHLNAIKW